MIQIADGQAALAPLSAAGSVTGWLGLQAPRARYLAPGRTERSICINGTALRFSNAQNCRTIRNSEYEMLPIW